MTTSRKIVECVPNFSEGRDMGIINKITDEIKKHADVSLLDVDPGEATNRTVVTFVGSPEGVIEAAFDAVKRAGELIDMRRHHGAHPRMGATDVLPLIPVAGITLKECAELARQLARRIADELQIPCYCYEAAAFTPERKNLAVCREGEYEALPEKLSTPGKQPDFGAKPFDEQVARTGCTVVGARDFLIAVNFNLNTTSTRRANAIAFDVREKGRPMREGGSLTGKILKDADDNTLMQPGTLKCTKAIGWFIDEYGIAQVSMNMTNLNVTPLHVAFDEVCRCASARGIRVTGTEIVGLIPKKTLINAGRYFLEKQQRSTGIPEADIILIAIKSMGLDDLRPFNPREKVIEYFLEDLELIREKAELGHIKLKVALVEKSKNDLFAENNRADRDSEVHILVFTELDLDTSVLRDSLFCDIKVRHDFESGDDSIHHFARRMEYIVKDTIHSETDTETDLVGLDVDIRCLLFDCIEQDHVNKPYDRRLLGILQSLLKRAGAFIEIRIYLADFDIVHLLDKSLHIKGKIRVFL